MKEINFNEINEPFNSLPPEQKSPKKSKTEGVGGKALETYQGNYQEWRSSQFNSHRDLHSKTVKPIEHKIEMDDVDELIDEFTQISSGSEEEIKDDDFIMVDRNKIFEPPEKILVPKKSPWSLGSITSVVASLFKWSSKKTSVTPDHETAYNLVNKIVGSKEMKEWLPLLKQLAPNQLKQLIPLLESLDKLCTKRLELLSKGEDVDNDMDKCAQDINWQIHEIVSTVESNGEGLKALFGVLNEQYKNANIQIFADNVPGAHISEAFNPLQGDDSKFARHFRDVKKFQKENLHTQDSVTRYLCQNQFVERNSVVYQSCHWEMELGKEMGEKRLFEKGYCKVRFAVPGSDLKEVRIPVDLRFLQLQSPDEVEVLLGLLSDKNAPKDSLEAEGLKKELGGRYINLVWPQHVKKIKENFQGDKNKLQQVLNSFYFEFKDKLMKGASLKDALGETFKEELKDAGLENYEIKLREVLEKEIEELEEGLKSFVDKCCEENFQQVKNMLVYVSSYVSEMIDKAQFSLGKDIHFEGVVSHFEVFPKMLLQKKCSQDESFEKAYNNHLNNLHEFRSFNIANFLKIESQVDFEKIKNVDQEHEKVIDFIKKDNSWTPQEKESAIKYLDYLYHISTSEWRNSSLTQVDAIEGLLKDWKAFFGDSQWPKDLNLEIAQMLVDPTTCRLMADFLDYAAFVQKQNQGALERGEKISIHSYHNSRLRDICSKIVDSLSERIEPLKKEELMLLLGKTLLEVYIEPPQESVESFENIEKMVTQKEKKPATTKESPFSEMQTSLRKNIREIKENYILASSQISKSGFSFSNVDKVVDDIENNIDNIENVIYESLKVLNRTFPKGKNKEFVEEIKTTFQEHIKMAERQYNELIEEYVQKCESFLPKNLAKDDKNKILKHVRDYIGYLKDMGFSLSSLEKVVNYMNQLESGYHQLLIQLASSLHCKTMLEKHGQFIMGFSMESPALLTEPLIPIMELMGSSRNIQITSDSYPQSVYHPSYVRFKGIGGGQRDLNLWMERGIEEYRKEVLRESSAVALELHYQPRQGSEHVGIKVLWHMEEGELLSDDIENNFNKKSRIFKKGNCELSLALPSLGDVRSCRVPLDLKPFALNDVESVFEVTKTIGDMMGDAKSLTERKELLLKFIERIKKEARYPGILENTQLFIDTALEFGEKLDLAFDKIVSSLGRPEVHFSDVEELGDLIPYNMLQNKLESHEEFRSIWGNYLKIIGEDRKLLMETYILSKEVDPNSLNSHKINELEKDLAEHIDKIFSDNEDRQIVKAYIKKINSLATEPWNSQENYHVKMMEQAISGFVKLQEKPDLNKFKTILFPLLAEGNSLAAFNEWVRALEVANEANSSLEKVTGDEFHNQRLIKKQEKLLEMLTNRPDLSEEEKNFIRELVNS